MVYKVNLVSSIIIVEDHTQIKDGLWKWFFKLFILTNAITMCMCVMNNILCMLVFVYMDDTIVYNCTWEESPEHVLTNATTMYIFLMNNILCMLVFVYMDDTLI